MCNLSIKDIRTRCLDRGIGVTSMYLFRKLLVLISFLLKTHISYRFHKSSLSGVPDYFGRNKISSGGDLSHYSSASLY